MPAARKPSAKLPSKPARKPAPKHAARSSQSPPAPTPLESRAFCALLEPDHTSLKWTVARVPFDASSAWPGMLRRRVAGTINGVPFRTSLFPSPSKGPGQVLLVNKKVQADAHAYSGDHAEFVLWPDLAERPCELPPELISAFDGDKRLHRWTLTLSESNRREIGKWIDGVKSAESRRGRAAQMAERLLLAMEGERETPPILEAGFRANPRARAGWASLTPNQRRGHLLGIFYYQTPDARARRARKAIEDALKAAAKLSPEA